MSHPYQSERETRTLYVTRSGERLLELLSRDAVQDTLGVTAVKLKALVEEAHVPPVTGPIRLRHDDIVGQSCLTLSYDKRDSDSVPIIALRSGETLTRHPLFYSSTPRQIANAEAMSTEGVVRPANQLKRRGQVYTDEYVQNDRNVRASLETTPLGEADRAVCMPLSLRCPRFDDFGASVTSLRWRPLLVVRYDPHTRHVPLGPLAQALMQAEQVLENPAYVTEGINGHEPLESAWLAEAQAIGVQVARLAGEQ